jgi:RNA polymerase sigma factor (sigma-70 family)
MTFWTLSIDIHIYAQNDAIEDEEAFLRRAVHNLAIDQYRHDRPQLHGVVPIEEADRLSPLIAPDPTPDVMLEIRQRMDCLTALLDAVSRRTREIYIAHRCGYTYAEIADDMDIAEITIKRHIARAQAALEHQRSTPSESVNSQTSCGEGGSLDIGSVDSRLTATALIPDAQPVSGQPILRRTTWMARCAPKNRPAGSGIQSCLPGSTHSDRK